MTALAHDRTGAGPPVVMLHGWPGDRTDWRAVVPLLAGMERIVPDLCGFGASPRADDYSAAGQARASCSSRSQSGFGPTTWSRNWAPLL